jgi:hypothetical protein
METFLAAARSTLALCSKGADQLQMDDLTAQKLRLHLDSANALLDSMNTLLTRERSSFHFSPFKIFMRKYNQLAQAVATLTPIDAVVDTFNLDKVPSLLNNPVGMAGVFAWARMGLPRR